jgi:hypothetical protein
MKKIILSVLVVFIATIMVFGQKTEREIKNMFAQIEKTNDDGKRTQLANQIQAKVVDAIFESEDFWYEFSSVRNIGSFLSNDNQIHMYTWNILLTDGTPLYFAVIQHYDFGGIYVLSQSEPIVPATTGYVTEANWYGALYYDIHPIKFKDKEMYMVFGLMTSTDGEVQHKVIDVMAFTKKTVKLGAPSFITPWTGKKKQHRVVFAYDKNAQLTLDYNKKKKMITFDHLEEVRQTSKGEEVMAPDGSYDALIYKKDIWSYQTDVKVKNKKEKKSKK